jgi:putative transposase
MNFPQYPNHIWVSDFTYIPFKGKFLYLATVMDLFTREVVGWSVLTDHSASLVLEAIFTALNYHPRPDIFHSDNLKMPPILFAKRCQKLVERVS